MSEQLLQVVLNRLRPPKRVTAGSLLNPFGVSGQGAPRSGTQPSGIGPTASNRASSNAAVLVIGGIGEGKTSAVTCLAKALLRREIDVDGVLASRIQDEESGRTVGYDLNVIRSGKRIPLAREYPPGQRVGKFYLSDNALHEAASILTHAARIRSVVILDEVGRLELAGRGHTDAIIAVQAGCALPVLTVRRSLVDAVRSRFGLDSADCYDVARGLLLDP